MSPFFHQLKMCVFFSSRKIYQSSAIRQICSGSLLSNNHPVVEPVAVATEKVGQIGSSSKYSQRRGHTYSKKEMFETTAQLSCAKLVRRDGQCRLCGPVLHENSLWYPEAIGNKNMFYILQSRTQKELHLPRPVFHVVSLLGKFR